MSVKQAREGYQDRGGDQVEAIERLRQVELFLENPVWKTVRDDLKEVYLRLLLDCPLTDDLMRARLQICLKMIDEVENHITLAHSSAEADVAKLAKSIKRDVRSSRNLFRR